MMIRIFLILLLTVTTFADPKVCKICRMDADNKGTFEIKTKDATLPFCSISCAKRYYKKKPGGEIKVKDFSTGNFTNANKAYFVHSCDKLADEIPNSMPPVVAGFAEQNSANEMVKRLQCGKISQGIDSVK